jgi:uncharacterized membrane protein HdeD (DUF308 family)
MELVTPFRHLVGMEVVMSVVAAVAAVLAGLVLLLVGIFSIMSLLWEDLIENDAPEGVTSGLSEAA